MRDDPNGPLATLPAPSAAPAKLSRQAELRAWLGGLPLDRRPWWLSLAVPVAIAAVYAVQMFWVCDDAFISIRYVNNFLKGQGLVFNPGEYVEGYTNFAWVLEVAVLWVLRIPPAVGSTMLSVAATIGTFILAGKLAFESSVRAYARWAVLLTLLLLAINRNVAVWTTSGLETRQFTFFVLLAVWFLRRGRTESSRLWWASASLAAAELTRPEAPLLWFCMGAWLVLDSPKKGRELLRQVARFALPFLGVMAAHYLWRRGYYGEWVPNTAVAKVVRPWHDAGLAYFSALTFESGLYLSVPVAVLGGLLRWFKKRDGLLALSAAIILPHAAYIVNVGGDHFEFRVVDFYWPLLAVLTTEGILALALAVQLTARRRRWAMPRLLGRLQGWGAFAVVAFYATVLQVAQYSMEYDLRDEREFPGHVQTKLTPESFPAAFVAPLMKDIAPAYDALMQRLLARAIAVRWIEHRVFQDMVEARYGPYARAERQRFPPSAILAHGWAGRLPFYLEEVTVIDTHGLADKVIARSGAPANRFRVMAHDRSPPGGYLEQRGVNIDIKQAEPTLGAALRQGRYAVELAPALFAPFDSGNDAWVKSAFAGLRWYELTSPRTGTVAGHAIRNAQPLLDCDQVFLSDWTGAGLACAVSPGPGQSAIVGQRGAFLSSYGSAGDVALGQLSRTFTVGPHMHLAFLVGGGVSGVGVELLEGGAVRQSASGQNDEVLRQVVWDLGASVGKTVTLRLFDRSAGGWGHLSVDEVWLLETAD